MASLLDRLNHELEDFGRRAQDALDGGRTRLELMRLRSQLDTAARELGYLAHRRECGSEVEQGRWDAALFKLDDLQKEIDRRESELAAEATPPAEVEVHNNGDADPTVATPS